jgi:hypothetical protein
MTAVLSTTMTLRIILSVRGSLAQGGGYAGSTISSSNRANSTHVLSSGGRAPGMPNPPHPSSFGPTASSFGVGSGNGVVNINGYERKGSFGLGAGKEGAGAYNGPAYNGAYNKDGTYTLDEMRDKAARGEWDANASDGRSSVLEGKDENAYSPPAGAQRGYDGVKVTIDREVDYHGRK